MKLGEFSTNFVEKGNKENPSVYLKIPKHIVRDKLDKKLIGKEVNVKLEVTTK